MRGVLTPSLAFLAGAAAVVGGPGVSARGISGSVSVVPHRVKIGSQARIVGSHLPANKYFTLILYIPDNRHPRLTQFVSVLPRSDGSGHLTARFTMPIVTQCGKATLYAYVARHATSVHSTFVVTGCRAGGKVTAPPPPPTKKPKKKH